MKKQPYLITEKALNDINQIWLYTYENWSIKQADRYYNLIMSEIKYIAENIESGKLMTHIKEGLRLSRIKSHLIFYKENKNNQAEIIRILHQSMDVPNRLND